MMADSEVRQRRPQAEGKSAEKPVEEPVEKPTDKLAKKSTKSGRKSYENDQYNAWLDFFRVLTFFFVGSCVLSYLLTDGQSYFWTLQTSPKFMKVDWWKAQFRGPIHMTLDELSAYDGTDPEKPLYLAINGTIYDVSNGRRMYGPGGSYSVFAGTDASRGFVTGCFAEDRTADMRGVEQMYLPLDDPEVDAHFTTAEIKRLRAEELEAAHERVHKALKHWVDFFAKSKKYTKVGYVKREKGWLEKLKPIELCAPAQKGRTKRIIPE